MLPAPSARALELLLTSQDAYFGAATLVEDRRAAQILAERRAGGLATEPYLELLKAQLDLDRSARLLPALQRLRSAVYDNRFQEGFVSFGMRLDLAQQDINELEMESSSKTRAALRAVRDQKLLALAGTPDFAGDSETRRISESLGHLDAGLAYLRTALAKMGTASAAAVLDIFTGASLSLIMTYVKYTRQKHAAAALLAAQEELKKVQDLAAPPPDLVKNNNGLVALDAILDNPITDLVTAFSVFSNKKRVADALSAVLKARERLALELGRQMARSSREQVLKVSDFSGK